MANSPQETSLNARENPNYTTTVTKVNLEGPLFSTKPPNPMGGTDPSTERATPLITDRLGVAGGTFSAQQHQLVINTANTILGPNTSSVVV